MEIRFLQRNEKPSQGFVRRERPCWIEFAQRMTWFSEMEFQPNGTEGMVYVWIKREENREYEQGHRRTRFCRTYRGAYRKNLAVIPSGV